MPEISATIRVVDAFSNPLDKLANGLSRAQSGFSRLKGALGGNMFGSTEKSSSGLFKSMAGGVAVGNMISKGMGLAGSGIRSMLGELNEASTSWQTFEGNMHQLGASNTQIARAKSDMQKFAQQTIYSASDMSSTYAQLAAVGTKNTAQLVKGFGGLASAADNPQQAMKTLSEQATQMAAKPKVQWQDFKLMLEQTPAGISAVAKTMGESTTSLIKDIQDGKVKTQDFLNAVAKTGTNANFSKMATQYKTVGQAMDGLKETLANKLQPAFDKVGKIGIKAVEGITDKLGNINGEKLGDSLVNIIQSVKSKFDNLKNNFMNGFSDSFNLDSFQNMLTSIGNAVNNVKNAFSGVGGSLANSLGSLSGKGLNGISSIITNIANAISKMSPGQIRAVGTAIASLAGALTLLKGASSVAGIISNIASGLSAIKGGLGTAFSGIKELPKAFSNIGQAKNDIAGFFSILKDGANAGSATYFADMLGGSKFGAGIGDMLAKVNGIKTAFASLAPAISGSFLPITGIILGVSAVVAGAVMAWKSNFLGFRDTVQQSFSNIGQVLGQTFSNLGQVFAPIRQAFSQIGQALAPALPAIRQFVTALGAVAGTGALLGLSMVVDIFKNIVSGALAAGNAIKGVVSVAKGLGAALSDIKNGDFSFSGVRKNFADAGKAFADARKNFHPFDFSTTEKTLSTAINNAKKSFGNSKVKMKADVDTSGINKKMSSATKGGNHKIKIGAKADLSSVNKQISSISKKQISAPKVKAPKVPQPKMPKVKTMPAPKIKTPKIPQPKMPKLKTIPAPKVQRPNMSGVVSAVRSGMNRAAAAARAGGAQISAAVRSALNQAVAAARSAAGAMQAAGVMIGAGLAAGIRSQIGAVAAAANELVAQANRAARAAAQIHSPSRLFAEVGSFIGQGMAVGMDSTRGLISQSSKAMINSAYPGLNSSINSSGSLSSSSIRSNSATSSNYYTGGTNNSSEVTIAPGAIVINSSGNPEEDADVLLDRLEEKIMEQADKSLS
ncbi:tape measure protein [Lactobacillus crispatus]|uniref:tape measure protein n=1 Tax=Lactobacillus crispatus TaxID=47770 RepID=UPI0015EC7E58|nr:tape measure protein [Lactobacillus crispatus]MBA2915523.1 tape measure protein [Lactobacillus crispatus]MBA2915683.1 tape measure protein [Lactobacillus crispatus]